MSENNDTSNESNSLGSDSQLISGGGGGGANPLIRSGVLRPSVLGPSVLGSSLNNASVATAVATATAGSNVSSEDVKSKEVVSSNPFMKEPKDDDEDEDNDGATAGGAVGGAEETSTKNKDDNGTTDEKKSAEDENETDERPDPLTMLRKNGLERSNLFTAAKNSIPRVEKSGFVFGQNVHERVVGDNLKSDSATNPENSDTGSTSGELLFSSVIQNAAKANENDGAAAKETETKTLTDVAREYEESRAQKRKYEEVETFTGEENEVNIVDVNCKLFAFVSSNWEERGRGSLRLNDSKKEQECSRVVFRSSGNLRLLLNTKVWAGMVAERPSQKSMRLTAMDNSGKIKIFLVMARPLDINQLHKALVERIDLRKASHPEECRGPTGGASVDDEDEAAAENNADASKNGATATIVAADDMDDDAEKAAAVLELPENDDPTEPTAKKSLLVEANN